MPGLPPHSPKPLTPRAAPWTCSTAPFLLPTPWYLLGTPTQYHTQQDHIEAKSAYDVSPTVPYPQRSYFAELKVSL